MKRSISSINNNRDTSSSQSKRTRTSTTMRQGESKVDTGDNHAEISSQKKLTKKNSQHLKDISFNDQFNRDADVGTTTSTPSGSCISFLPSSSKSTSSSKNRNRKTDDNTNQSLQSQHKANSSAVSQTRTSSTTTKSINNTDRTTTRPDSNSQARSWSSTTTKKQLNSARNSTTDSYENNLSSHRSSSFNDLTNATTNNFSIHSLVEGSVEYRELKRLYIREKNLVDEWKKDYQVLKRQLNDLKTSTIPRPTAEVVEWLEELFEVMNNSGTFKGDGRTLNEIGEDLKLDVADLVTVAARTPQKSALKLFRLLYPTISSRAECQSIKKIPKEQLQNIYVYVRTLHPNLNFRMIDMKNAIGTSIRSAKCELRKLERHRQQQLNIVQNDENIYPVDRDEQIEDAIRNIDAALHETDAASDDNRDEDDDEDDEDLQDKEVEDEDEDESLKIDDELDEDNDED